MSKALSEIPYINIDVPPDTKEASVCKNKIIYHIIKILQANNDGYYIEHKEGSNMYKVLEDLQQKR